MSKTFPHTRLEKRTPMAVGLQITGHAHMPGIETTFTENVSSRGARVVTMRRWQPNDRVWITSLPGDFRCLARVAYCEPLRGEGFAIGVEFLQPTGPWVIGEPAGAGKSQNG